MRYKFKNRPKTANSIKLDRCYAKTEFDGIQTVLGMTVFQHCCAAGFAAKAIRGVFSILADKGMFPEGFPLVVSLHDTGKISPSFQKALGKALPSPLREAFLAENGLKDFPEEAEINHSVVSCAALKDVLGDVVAYIAGAHHGEFTASPSSDAQICGGHAWQEARMSLLESLKKVFGDTISQKISSLGEDNDDTEIQFILGLTVVADWISSSVSLAEFKSQGPLIFVRKVREAGFIKQVYRKGLSFTDIFGFNMRPEQLALVKSFSGPGVYILEASMGSGKTEAALYIAYLLLSSGLATGLYFALPTRFTAQQIYLRVQRFLKVIMDAENSAEAKLVFSNSFLYNLVYTDDFRARSWFDSRKRLILSPFGVGTIDQALMSVLNVRHSAVRTFGLAGKVVIIDEVHSYDSYTGSLINRLVKQLEKLQATVIILSATLRKEAKKDLLGCELASLTDYYPCITRKIGSEIAEYTVPAPSAKLMEVKVLHDDSDAIDEAIALAMQGAFVLWIENTVSEAQNVYKIFSARCEGLSVRTGLLHSRFIGPDRIAKEAEYISAFGKDGWDKRDGNGYILVGTQILEQSLDIDADALFTRLVPVDMILQRMGRVWRHEHAGRTGKPRCFILSPLLSSVISCDSKARPFGDSGAIYADYVLYRTLIELEGRNQLLIPDDIRTVIENVYADRTENNPVINKMKSDVAKWKEKLSRLAAIHVNHIGKPLPDEAAPRYSELKTRKLLLLAKVAAGWSKVWLLNGVCLDLSAASTPKEKASIALQLEECIITVPVTQCPDISPVDKETLLSHFIFLPDSEEEAIRVILCSSGGNLEDLSGNQINNFRYSPHIGYYKKERG